MKLVNAGSLFSSVLGGLFLFSSLAQAVDWQLESDRDGIKVYSKKEEANPVLSFKGEGIINFPYEDVYKVLANPEEYDQWMPMVKDSRVTKNTSDNEKVVYIHIGMPWPLKDRFFYNLGQVKRLDADAHLLEIHSIPAEQPHPDKVEGWTNFSFMKMKKLDQGQRAFLEIELNQDPKGRIPVFMVNWVQASWPRDFFVNLRTYMQKRGESGAK